MASSNTDQEETRAPAAGVSATTPAAKAGAKSAATPKRQRPGAPSAAAAPPVPRPSFGGAPEFVAADLTLGGEIGKGRFKRVLCGRLRSRDGGADKDVVVVRYSKSGDQKQELHVLAMLGRQGAASAKFVPEIHGACAERREIVVLLERAFHGSLAGAVEGKLAEQWTQEHRLVGSSQVAEAMNYLQSIHVVHADLSCRNLLVFRFSPADPSQTQVKVTDFGLAVVLQDGADHETLKQPMAPRWCPPEQVIGNKMSHRTDVWSLGATLFEFFSNGRTPWVQCEKRANVIAKLTELAEIAESGDQEKEAATIKEGFPLPDGCAEATYELILSCMKVDENLRPTFADLQIAFADLAKPKPDVSCDMDSTCSGEAESTKVTPRTRPHGRFGAWEEHSVEDKLFASRCEDLREFLVSGEAMRLFGEEGAVDAFKAFLISREARHLRAAVASRSRGSSACISARLGRGASATSVGYPAGCPLLDEFVALTDDGTQAHLSGCASFSGRGTPYNSTPRLHDPRTPGGATPAWTWAVQSLVGPALLRKQEFMDRASAWAAYSDSAASGIPCMMRDPRGGEVAQQAWLVMDHTHGATPRPTTPALGAALLSASPTCPLFD